MSSSEFAALAERYLDLWRRQARAIAEDPAAVRATDEFMRFFTAALGGIRAAGQDGHGQTQQSAAQDQPQHQTGAEAARGASRGSQSELSDILRRIATLESRIARLEDAATGKKLAGKARRPGGTKARPEQKRRKPASP